jgi:divalent metal cation (Fe/Co/Zn/Cd) transporter
MEVFGIELQELIFSLFLPFLFFYILLFALLKKSKILGENANRLNSLLALVISALGIFSLYSLGLSYWLPFLAAFLAVAAFVSIFLLGVGSYSIKKTSSYVSGEAFKSEDEKKFDAGIKNCEAIWERFKKAEGKAKEEALKEMMKEVSSLEPIASKLGKSLYEFDWYKEYKSLIGEVKERS